MGLVELITTHLKSKSEWEDLRHFEAKEILRTFDNVYECVKGESSCPKFIGRIIGGDFNAEPDWKCVGGFKNRKELKCVFDDAKFTTFKQRDKIYKRVIDYIFYGGDLNLENRLDILENHPECGLPSSSFPSDHLYLLILCV